MTVPNLFWIIFTVIIIAFLWIDFKFVHKKAHAVSIKEAAFWSIVWIVAALSFGAGIYFFLGHDKALSFLTAYLIEKMLSVDNLFVFLIIFDYFAVPQQYQPRVLHWGILGALVMRFILIFAGVTLINKFEWIIYVFGALLIYTGVKMIFEKDKKLEPGKNPALKLFKKFIPVAMQDHADEKFFVRINGILHATPLFVALLIVESSDLIFAVDSIPAVLAISSDPFIVYTSNVFAILGLRALYFLLSGIMPLFIYLKFGISVILCYVGIKMMMMHFYKVPTGISLLVVMGILIISVVSSVLFPKKAEELPNGA
jgi:tellurite resistance protein TerC